MTKQFIYPAMDGVIAVSSKACDIAYISSGGKVEVKKVTKGINFKLFNIFFIRGLLFLFYGIKYTFYGIFGNYKHDNLIKNNKSKNNFLNIIFYSFLVGLFVIFIIFIFSFLPLKLSFVLAPKNYNIFFKRLIIFAIKIVLITLIFTLLKFLPAFSEYYKFNHACIINQNERLCVNFLAYFFISYAFSTFFICMLGMPASAWYFFVYNLLLTLICYALCYELCLILIKSKRFSKIFFAIEGIFAKKSSLVEEKCVNIAIEEFSSSKGNNNLETNLQAGEWLFKDVYLTAKDKLQKHNKCDESDLDFIFCEVLNKKRAELKLVKKISASEYKQIMSAVERRSSGEPITKIFGRANFYGLWLIVNKNVLSPRMETEILVEEVLKEVKPKQKVLDLCTGSGAIGIAIAKNSLCNVTATDYSSEALEVAKINAHNLGVKINFVLSDMFLGLGRKDKFDIIVSNPPYIKTSDIALLDDEVKNYDPLMSLDGGEDGLYFYRVIAEGAPKHLKSGGKLFLEVGIDQHLDVKKLLQKNFKDIRIVKDYNKINRVVIATLN